MHSRGFTLLEVVLAIGILLVIFVVGFQADSVFQNVLAGRGSRQVESVLGLAAMRARNGMNGSNWGVYLAYDDVTRVASEAVLFSGASYASRDTTQDILFPLGRTLKFPSVQLSGALPSSGNDHEILFTFLTGETPHYGSLTVSSYAATTQIDIPATGIPVRHE
ncbi:hypothetical protein A3C09_03170 [Candidatus Uhrbacteria bacterium RIFCSPHIGHO2_02_FULL_47_44]|uniref:General secretion pathway GspH domain-containing protein n=1 Tax=Candidatus Uhrbacteria bacterium RIFCSPLOWO2_02_FULL_48_18 TaxID=1802408 RepID=A0A1F7V7M6_9BACT|nr:MAG: hypothetical protein A2839_03150 [Candidatus Uhrbacteria bacterium RIFCSPHIGHO2_01_FULL_47_10]OGL70913.1 MAG: hypothetical protein A3C09_03170 [Candidatus Uhrbacteria bacterium RIFCSPHIGHO2_02_FULL_47_44]OGL76976.1 MAG: hypothetical protein A3E97_05225 [Candidatus Uhrbacteria bacterium RIFCSPHIGHO2_12_FULL_47_12]OGL80762.1 MAG: hypothetical protein A3B20_05250 [Candidatus Uhrbacteria bacterium RIFCSPLOWO2_01_FULL_47_17]OGL86586.1 MAG: hypothetical protein A3I41_04850 [Candidatus Uhrbact